ncbi:KTSC domain-containing protein [Mesorhizobium sp. WSM1497]|uniref:KTSC domain-containing protein n=1 Tax=Mesorhizobium sp. WSM1497 TaxID=278153 RepID=UPI0007EDC3BD|nr:KTSC domain-containing protein [Mesorhizobium sp. WSM1497]ARP63404.1 KTSC domain-containing protein [Mesorhizobium sp. WSM1497]
MEREPVSSSSIVSIGYEPESETLEVEFKNSGIYQYFNVPLFMHERLLMADSIGSFFNTEIKEAYPCSKM